MNYKHTALICIAFLLMAPAIYAGVSNWDAIMAGPEGYATPDVAQAIGSIYAPGTFEVDGTSRFDGIATFTAAPAFSAGMTFPDDVGITFGTGSDSVLLYDETTSDRTTLTTGAASGFNVLTGNLFVGNGVPILTPSGEDLYVEGTSELTNHVYTKANLYLVDDAIAAFGAVNDAYFWYDETTDDLFKLTIASATGGLQLQVGNLFVGNGSPGQTINGEDAYIEGLLEVDGIAYLDAGATVPVDITSNIGAYALVDDNAGSGMLELTAGATEGLNVLVGNILVGDGTPGQTIDGEDLFVDGLAEINGVAYLDGGGLVPDDIAFAFGSDSDFSCAYDETTDDVMECTGDLDLAGDLTVAGLTEIESTEGGGASVGNLIKQTNQAGDSYSGTNAGLIVKNYDEDGTIIHNGGESTGLAIFYKQNVAMTAGGKSSLATFHNYPGSVDPDFGQRFFGDTNESMIQMAAGTSDIGIDMSIHTNTTADIKYQNGETILNSPDGTLDFGAANLTTSGTVTGSGVFSSAPLVVASAANVACDTTCGSEANCSFGQNTGDMALVDCDGATADVCFCYQTP